MSSGFSPEWLNQNSTRAYPLAENSSRLDITGSIKIPDSLLVAAQINAASSYAAGVFYISQVAAFPDQVSITIGYLDPSGSQRNIAIITALISTFVDNTSFAFTGQGADASVIGSLTFGNLLATLTNIPGVVNFSPSATPFEVNALFISVPALQSVQLYNGNTLVETFSQILMLRAGSNIQLSYVGNNTIRIDAVSGANLTEPSTCANAIPIPPCIRTINGIPGDANNNFNIEGGTCITINTDNNGIDIIDNCSSSCCGCTELEVLMTSLNEVESQVQALVTQISTSSETLATMVANLVSNLAN